MQYVDDNMEELMRKAAEQYPLNTEGADWNAVMQKMEQTPNAPQEEKPKKRRRFLWLLLLLPAALLLFTITNNKTASKNFESVATAKKTLDKSQPVSAEPRNNVDNKQNLPGKQNNTTTNVAAGTNNLAHATHNDNNASIDRTALQSSRNNIPGQEAAHDNNEIISNENANSKKNNKTVKDKSIEINNEPATSVIDNKTAINNEAVAGDNSEQKIVADTAAATGEKSPQTVAVNKTVKKNFSLSQHTGFYAGLSAGFDVSTIKRQKIRGTGYSLSALIGYKVSKHISVETALMLDEKKYYSDGKYFDTKRTGLPANDKVLNLYGTCNMFEIPINVKYDFAAKKSGNFFAIGGLSTYIMKKESYHYYADYMGDYYHGFRKYSNSGSNVFSVLNLAAGYQFNIQKAGKLRIEPYLKVPLSGIGIGSMPITSAGISVGFTKQF